VRTDGTPTYNFCVVVDDVTMKITHVIRGNDQSLEHAEAGALLPGPRLTRCRSSPHIPMILAADKTRLSKRQRRHLGAGLRDMGLPARGHAVNYLARLGWSHGDQEIFSRDDLVRHFDLAHVARATRSSTSRSSRG